MVLHKVANTQEKAKVERTLQGEVISNKMEKTVVVLIQHKVKHPKYNKYVIRKTKLHAHDAENVCNEGDVVIITQCRPRSKMKSWEVQQVVSK